MWLIHIELICIQHTQVSNSIKWATFSHMQSQLPGQQRLKDFIFTSTAEII